MHRALQIAALHDLPFTTRRVALAAANGSLPSLQALLVVFGRNPTLLVLPVVYILLNPARIPTPEAFEAILEHNGSDHAIATAILAWDLLLKSRNIPLAAVPDLWPRLWAWFEFLDTYRDSLSRLLVALPEASYSLITGLLSFTLPLFRQQTLWGKQAVDLIKRTSGFYAVVGRVWSFLLTDEDEEGIDAMLDFVTPPSQFNDDMLEQLSDGAGGSLGALASLVTRHIRHIVAEQPGDNMRFALRLLDALVCPVELVVQGDTGVALMFLSALLDNGVIESILHTVIALCQSSDSVAIDWCFTLLRRILYRRPIMERTVNKATDRALELLLRSIIDCASITETHGQLVFFLRDFLPGIMLHHRSLSSMQIAFENLQSPTSTLSFPELPEWQDLQDLVRWRSSAFSKLSSTCDNIKCNRMSKDLFKRCSGCGSTHYCSEGCQKAHWREGGHRECCYLDRRLSLISGCGLSFRERLHMRALLNTDYAMHQSMIFCQIARCLRAFPDAGYFVVFDYTSVQITTSVYSLAANDWGTHASALKDSAPEWKDYVARAARSDGRFTIHVTRYLSVVGVKYWVIPLRSSTPTIDAGLRRIAEDPAIGDDGFVDAVNALIATVEEDREFDESH
ncbi:hypothetical protein C8F04DRAFT_1265228 [Mycena alexandri]|uniref:MYND-type domain-containing protein n=1 Tax=Mycena alexandri TaxID=1745969 RepID=A0AAD6WZE6_9AGAR|nr:hypothetical protein C8F04DRAFT_1265228 [Mycena alexandri]